MVVDLLCKPDDGAWIGAWGSAELRLVWCHPVGAGGSCARVLTDNGGVMKGLVVLIGDGSWTL